MAYRGAKFSQKGCPMVHWIMWKFNAKNQGPDSRDEKKINLLSNFRDIQTDIIAYRGAICNQKRSPRLHLFLGTLHAKKQGSESRKIQAF